MQSLCKKGVSQCKCVGMATTYPLLEVSIYHQVYEPGCLLSCKSYSGDHCAMAAGQTLCCFVIITLKTSTYLRKLDISL